MNLKGGTKGCSFSREGGKFIGGPFPPGKNMYQLSNPRPSLKNQNYKNKYNLHLENVSYKK